jgi:iron complex transport system permease protein
MSNRSAQILFILAGILVLVMGISLRLGAVPISWLDMLQGLLATLKGNPLKTIEQSVFMQLRLPRILVCAMGGAILSVSGVLMQAVFRNPIVEPGMLGTSAGAALGASLVIAFAGWFPIIFSVIPVIWLQPLLAFLMAALATYFVVQFAGTQQVISTSSLLLAGMSINAVALSLIGLISYFSRDPQARSITFWNLGSFSGVNWLQCMLIAVCIVPCWFFCYRKANQLDTLMLGYNDAIYAGTDVKKTRNQIMIVNMIMVAVLTCFVGVIAFMGMIIPHIVRMLLGSNHRILLPASAIGGAIILCVTDLFARLVIAPAELPIGIITSLIGAPLFLYLLRKFGLLQSQGGVYD